MRRNKLLILITSLLLAAAAVVTFAASAAARRAAPHTHVTSATTTRRHGSGAGNGAGPGGQGAAGAKGGGPMAPVSAALGLRPGAVSPSAAGIAAAQAVLPKLTAEQLAGQRVIYSYKGLTPPNQLLTLIRKGDVAGVIFFTDNVGTSAHIAAVVKELQQANASPANPVRLPLLLMTDQEGGVVRRLDGPPTLSAKQIGEHAASVGYGDERGRRGGLVHARARRQRGPRPGARRVPDPGQLHRRVRALVQQ